jgi:hypothetical protein
MNRLAARWPRPGMCRRLSMRIHNSNVHWAMIHGLCKMSTLTPLTWMPDCQSTTGRGFLFSLQMVACIFAYFRWPRSSYSSTTWFRKVSMLWLVNLTNRALAVLLCADPHYLQVDQAPKFLVGLVNCYGWRVAQPDMITTPCERFWGRRCWSPLSNASSQANSAPCPGSYQGELWSYCILFPCGWLASNNTCH